MLVCNLKIEIGIISKLSTLYLMGKFFCRRQYMKDPKDQRLCTLKRNFRNDVNHGGGTYAKGFFVDIDNGPKKRGLHRRHAHASLAV